MLHLVNGIVYKQQYMSDDNVPKPVTRIVDADSISAASSKFVNHYESMTDEYTVYYTARVTDCSPIIY
jgi:hypothetical protein